MILHAIILGIIEGLTEFIPVSSTGHLLLVQYIAGISMIEGYVFEIAIQFGAILAVCFAYRAKLVNVVVNLPKEREAQLFTRNILLAFLPAVVIGATAHGFIKSALFDPYVISAALIIGGIIIIVVERMDIKPRYHRTEEMGWARAIAIGLCQTLAMVPGTSRSGATIIGALLMRVDRKAATEFSFFLAIPTMLAATVYDLYKNRQSLDMDDLGIIAIGFVAAFAFALMVVRGVIAFISKHGFTPFGYYRILIGSLMLAYLLI